MQCAQREVNQRKRVYARWVTDGRMTAAFAKRETDMMQEICFDYGKLAKEEEDRGHDTSNTRPE